MDKGERTRERILDVALEEFAAKGPAGARVNDIAARADINKERIYAYFGSKDGLFTAVLHHVYERMRERDHALDHLGEDDLPQLTGILLRHFVRSHQQDPRLWRIIAWENLDGGTHLDAVESLATRGYGKIENLYRLGQERGLYPAAVPFASYIQSLIALVWFHHSNRLTMERTLGTSLGSKAATERYIKDVEILLGGS